MSGTSKFLDPLDLILMINFFQFTFYLMWEKLKAHYKGSGTGKALIRHRTVVGAQGR